MAVNVSETEKIAVKFPLIYLKNRNIVAVNTNLTVSSLIRMLMVNYSKSNLVHAFEVAFTVIFT